MAYSSPSVQPLINSELPYTEQSIINIYINVIILSSYSTSSVVQVVSLSDGSETSKS